MSASATAGSPGSLRASPRDSVGRAAHPVLSRWPRRANGGRWATSHVQGIAADPERGHLYYSFTTLLVKTDLAGRVLGTVQGFTGHLGDVTFSAAERKLYASLEYKAAPAFYVAVFDVDAIDRPGLDAANSAVVRTVHLSEVTADYGADSDRPGRPASRYGCSGIDGISLGPAFGSTDPGVLLTVAYGIFADVERADNDHQVLLQYRTEHWDRMARPLDEAAPHRSGPQSPDGKYFARTGNTRFGVQNLEYDAWSRRWFLGVYAGSKSTFPNYTLFAVDATIAPESGPLLGVPDGRGELLRLADDGLWDPLTGIRGWYAKADVGIQSLGDGLFYLSTASEAAGLQTSDLTLCRWTGDPAQPFSPVRARGRRTTTPGRAGSPALQL